MVKTEPLVLRGLDPVIDSDLFREAYSWRTKHNALPFESFSAPDPSQAVMGLFNGEFVAVYMIKEYAPSRFDMHFTSKRRTLREYLIAGGIQVTSWLIKNGAVEVSAVIVARNHALRRFLTDCGYTLENELTFDNSPYTWLRYVA